MVATNYYFLFLSKHWFRMCALLIQNMHTIRCALYIMSPTYICPFPISIVHDHVVFFITAKVQHFIPLHICQTVHDAQLVICTPAAVGCFVFSLKLYVVTSFEMQLDSRIIVFENIKNNISSLYGILFPTVTYYLYLSSRRTFTEQNLIVSSFYCHVYAYDCLVKIASFCV